MKTDDLIKALSQDRTVAAPPSRRIALELACGGAMMIALFSMLLGPRPDLSEVLSSPRFLLKPIVSLILMAAALGLLLRVAVPVVVVGRWRHAFWLPAALLMSAVLLELLLLPSAEWSTRAIGHNGLWCLTMIPMLAIAPLACALHALRAAAPGDARLAGAVAGLCAAGFAATAYALHCSDDSPLFVALWYLPAMAVVTTAGAVAGDRLLRG